MQFTVEFKADYLVRAYEAVCHEIAAPEQMLGSIGESLLIVNKDRHGKGLAPDGTPWKALASSTQAEGGRKGGPLNKTGRMLQSFHYQVQADTLKLSFDGERDGKLAAIHHGGSDPYTITATKAKALKFGGLLRKRVHHPGLPARQVVGFPVADQKLTADVIGDHLTAILNHVR